MAKSSINQGDRILRAYDSLVTGATGYVNGRAAPIAKIDQDGQNGITTDYRTLNMEAPYIRQNILCFLLEAPGGFQFMPNAKELVAALKALVETKAEKIDGLDNSIKAEYTQVAVGASEQMDAFTRSTRERSEPSFTWYERYGRAIGKFFELWIVMLLGDPITGIPGVVTLNGNEHLTGYGNANNAYVLMPEMTSATMLFIEPDPTHSYPINAWLCTNMMPDNAGDATGSRDKQSAPDKQEITVKFTCLQECNYGVMNLAADLLASIKKTGLNSMMRRAYLGDNYDQIIQFVPNLGAAPGRTNNPTSISSATWDTDTGMKVGYRNQAEDIANSERVNEMALQSNREVLFTDPQG